jgi:hypothetical protein
VRRQNYPYLNPDEDWEGVKAKGLDKLYGRDYNCLVFCEVVQSDIAAENPKPRTLPAGSRLAFTGNLADASTPGSYVLDHRTYFFHRILKDLKQLCVAVNVIPLKPEMGVDQDQNHYFRSGLAVGANPPDRENLYPDVVNQDPADPDFDFKYIGPGEYKWSKRLAAPGSHSETKTYTNCTYAPIWRKWDMNSTQSVTVKWTAGDNKITVTGDIKYRHWEAYSTKHDNWGWNGDGNDPFYYGRISIDVTWSFDIILKGANVGSEGAGLVPEIVGIANGLPTNFKIKPQMIYVLDNTLTRLTEDVQKNMTKSLASITKNLTEGFKNTGKLTYPGTRTLMFGSPQINNYGDILTTITYQPLGKDLITLQPPKAGDITDPPVFDDPKPPQDSLIFTPQGHLSWNISFKSYDPKSSRAKLVLIGSNASNQPFALDLAHVELLSNSGKDATSLFTDRDRWETPAEIEDRKEKAEKEWQQKREAERQRQIAIAKKEFEASKAKQVGEQQKQVQGIDTVRKERTAKFDEAVRAYNVEKARVDEAKRLQDAAKKLEEARKREEQAAEQARKDREKKLPGKPATSGGTKLPEEPAASDGKKLPKEPAVSDGTLLPEEPAASDGKKLPKEPAVSDGTLLPEEPAASDGKKLPGKPAVSDGTKLPEEPAASGGTKLPEEPAASGEKKLPDEPAKSGETGDPPKAQENGKGQASDGTKPSGTEDASLSSTAKPDGSTNTGGLPKNGEQTGSNGLVDASSPGSLPKAGDGTGSDGQGRGAKPDKGVEPTDPAFSAAEKAMQAARAALDETEKVLREANAKLEQLSKQPFDEKTVVVKLPEPPKAPTPEEENLQIYGMTTSNIMESLVLTVQPDGESLFFKIKQKPKGTISKKSLRWFMRPGSSFTITIEGTVGKPGSYAAQIQETWNSMDPNVDFKRAQFSDVFWKFMLLSGGSALAESSTWKDTNVLRGIVPPPADKPAI